MGKNYNVGSSDDGWCGYKLMVIVGIMVAVCIYTLGAVATGTAYRTHLPGKNCTCYYEGDQISVETGDWFNTPLVVVGPAFMSAGGAIVDFIIYQWCFCRPV